MTNLLNFKDVRKFAESDTYKNSVNFQTSFEGFASFQLMQDHFNTFKFLNNPLINQVNLNTCPDICGFMPNVPAYLNNEPQDMFNFEQSEQVNLIELNLYISLPSTVNAKEIDKNGKILAAWLAKNTTAKDRFKINLCGQTTKIWQLGKKGKTTLPGQKIKINLCDFNDYITPDILAMLCSPAAYRYYYFAGRNMLMNKKVECYAGAPVHFNDLPDSDNFINFMNMEHELKIKFNY